MKRKIAKWVAFAQDYSLPLIIGIVVSLIWANISYDSYRSFVETPWFGTEHISLHFLIKEVFMALFFALAMVEIVEAVSPGGAMYPIKKAVNPLMATAGGVMVPSLFMFCSLFSLTVWNLSMVGALLPRRISPLPGLARN